MNKIRLTDKKIVLAIILMIGIFLVIYSGGSSENVENPPDSALVLETKIASLLKKTYRSKDVSVILTYDTSGEKITQSETKEEKSVFSGSGNVPFVVSEKLPYVRGAVVSISEISEDEMIEIQQAVATLLGINSTKVNVISSDSGG